MFRTTLVLALAVATLNLAPSVWAHDARELDPVQDGKTLVALWIAADEEVGLPNAPPLFDGPAGALAVAIPGGRIAAAHDGRFLVLDLLVEGNGWYIVAVDDEAERSTHVAGVPATVRMFEAAGATGADVPDAVASRTGSLGVFGAADGGAHGHGSHDGPMLKATTGAANAWLEWQSANETEDMFATVIERTHSSLILRFAFPADALGSGLKSGHARDILIYRGASAAGVPAGPFLSALGADVEQLTLYSARMGESPAVLQDLAAAMDGRADLKGGLLPIIGIAVLAGGALVAMALAGELPGARRITHKPLPSAQLVTHKGVGFVAFACLVLLLPAVVMFPTAEAADSKEILSLPKALSKGRDPCSWNAPVRTYDVSAIDLDIIYNRWGDHDPEGMMYVLDHDRSAVKAERARLQPVLAGDQSVFPNGTQRSLIQPLTLRAQLGECVEIRFTNRLDRNPPPPPDDPLGGEEAHVALPHAHGLPPVPKSALPLPGPDARRASLHVHGLPLDPRVSGGDALGNNPDNTVGIGETVTYKISAAYEGVFFFHDHADPTSAGRSAFPALNDAFRGGTVHGLFGSLIVEPAGATWTDPLVGGTAGTTWAADIHVPGEPSFREFVIYYHDPQLVARDNGSIREPSTDHGFNYRVETLSHRLFDDLDRCPADAAASNAGINPCEDISLVYSSNVHGDPGTPIPRAYLGDPVKFRLVHAGMEEAHAHHLHGHRWQAVDGDKESTRIDSQTITPSETFTETLEAGAGGEGVSHGPGDFIFHCHLFPHLYGGMWSFFRVHDRLENDLHVLPATVVEPPSPTYRGFPHFIQEVSQEGYRPLRAPQQTGIDPVTGLDIKAVGSPYFDVCPPDVPLRKYRLAAIEVPVRYNRHGDHDPGARIFVLAEDADAILAGATNPDPAILRIRQGECMTITLQNRFPVAPADAPIKGVGKVSIHTHLLEYDVLGADGTSTGWIFDQTIWQDEEITYRFYADRDLQTIVWHDHAAGLETAFKGIYGATLVEPSNAEFRSPVHGRPIYTMGTNTADGVFDSARDPVTGRFNELWRADIVGPGFKDFREFFASVQDFANLRNAKGVPYRDQISDVDFADFGLMGLNLRSEPLWHRLGDGKSITNSSKDLFSSTVHGDPSTNLWQAYAGDRTVVRFHQVAYEEIHAFQLGGHRWNFGYRDSTSPMISSQTLGISEAFNAYLDCGAGGCSRTPGDYLYRTGGLDDIWAGGWGIFRVLGKSNSTLLPLPDAGFPKNPNGGRVCDKKAPDRWFDVVAIEKELIYNRYGDHDQYGRMYVLASEEPLVRQGLLVPKPLTLRVTEGDCVHIRLTNRLPEWSLPHAHADPQPTGGFMMTRDGPVNETRNLLKRPIPVPSNHVSMHAPTFTYNLSRSDGGYVGYNPDTTVPPGGSREYTWYADIPAPGAVLIEDLGDVLMNRHHGLFGAIVVLPKKVTAYDPVSGLAGWNSPVADVRTTQGGKSDETWRDIAVFVQNGVALTSANGFPMALAGGPAADVDEAAAALFVQAALRDALPGGATRARLTNVGPGPTGFHVTGTLEGVPFRGEVHRREGLLIGMEFGGDVLSADSRVSVTNAGGSPIAGVSVRLNATGFPDSTGVTNATGVFTSHATWPRGSTAQVLLGGTAAGFTAWTDSERRIYLDVRTGNDLVLAATAGELGLKLLRDAKLPAGPIGLTGVDVSSAPWRVAAEDALREYVLTIDPTSRRPTTLSFTSKAIPFGPLSVVTSQNATRIAQLYVKDHFGSEEQFVHAAQSRFGFWQIDLGRAGTSTSIGIDGVTGRILYLQRGGAGATIGPQPPDQGVVLRFRSDDGGSLDGEPIRFERSGVVIETGTLGHGGRYILQDSIIGGERSASRLHAILPGKGLDLPISLAPEGTVFADIHGVGATTAVKIPQAVEHAYGELARLAPPGGALLRASWGIVGIVHAPGEWVVSLASAKMRADIRIDDATGSVGDTYFSPWRTPVDDCASQPPEHFVPHPSPACRWSFAIEDEENQGLHGYNYRAEPLEHRYNRIPDPAAAFSSALHGENGVPVWHAHIGDRVTMHVLGAGDKARATAFSVSGHVWPIEPQENKGAISQGQGGVAPGRVFILSLHKGAGGGTTFDGDYLVQGAVQRSTAETGEWGILRVLPPLGKSVKKLVEPTVEPLPPANAPAETFVKTPKAVPRMSVKVIPNDGGGLTPQIVDVPSLPTGERVPVRVDIIGDGKPTMKMLDIQVRTAFASVVSIVGTPVNSRDGGTFYALLDVPVTGAARTDEIVIDLVVGPDAEGPRAIGTTAAQAAVTTDPWERPPSSDVDDDIDPERAEAPDGLFPPLTRTDDPSEWDAPAPEDEKKIGTWLGLPTSPWVVLIAIALAAFVSTRRRMIR